MGVFSKFAERFASVPYNCYELAHPLTESCSQHSLDALGASLRQSVLVYGAVYGLNRVVTGRFSKTDLAASLVQVTRSSLFLSFNVYFFTLFICQQYHLLGVFRSITPLISGLLSSFLAIQLEARSRRKLLSMYMLNVATEVLYRILWRRWQLRPVPYFDVVLYAVSLAAVVSRPDSANTPIVRTLEFLTGARSDYDRQGSLNNQQQQEQQQQPQQQQPQQQLDIASTCQMTRTTEAACSDPASDPGDPCQHQQRWWTHLKAWLQTPPSHDRCCSTQQCLVHALHTGGRAALMGWTASVALAVPNLLRGRPPAQLFTSKKSFGLAAFLGGTAAGTNVIQCFLEKRYPQWRSTDDRSLADSARHRGLARSLAVLLSALSMAFYRSNSFALYVFWRAIELRFVPAASQRRPPALVTETLYALCCGLVFHAVIFEPQLVRRSYVQFLDRLSGSKLSQMNRRPLEMYGYPPDCDMTIDYRPEDFNLERVSPRFVEMVLVWSLQ